MGLKEEIKELIAVECDKGFAADDISDSEALFGPSSKLELDSIDALQISMALQKKYGITLNDSKELRRVMESVNTLAAFIEAQRG
ncbi:MAG: phosphopantetheine-binding protein [Campylobacterales bacterium]|nr:phosphopantetheine-binding protein [Campylobacterales bacterium]